LETSFLGASGNFFEALILRIGRIFTDFSFFIFHFSFFIFSPLLHEIIKTTIPVDLSEFFSNG
jgi:hypothetical protein